VRFYESADERGEASFVVLELLRMREAGVGLGSSAIFYRTHAQSRPLEEELLKYNVPYVVVGGTRFYDRAEVKDALAYLRALRNRPDNREPAADRDTPRAGSGAPASSACWPRRGRGHHLRRALERGLGGS